jgi:hypothetical protein
MRAPRLFSVPAFRFSLVDPKSAVGKWSRIATFGPKSKDGAEMMFDATTLGQMVDNAAARGDRIAIDNDHASAYPETRDAPALGFFGALAVVAGGKVVKSWNGSPDPVGLADGLYGRLDEITPRGEDPLVGLANYRTLSPMFVEEGTDEQNRPIGYALLNVAATNVPFQSGAEIMFFGVPANGATANSPGAARAFQGASTMGWNANLKPGDKIRDNRTGKVGTVKAIQRDGAAEVWWDSVDHGLIMPQGEPPPDLEKLSQSNTGAARAFQGASMNPEMMKRIGFADGAQPTVDEKMNRYARHFAGGDATEEDCMAMAADLEASGDESAKKMAQVFRDRDWDENAAIHTKTGNTHDETNRTHSRMSVEENDKLAALARTLGVPPTVAAIEAAVVPMSQFSALQSRLATIEAERAAEKKAAADRKVSELVDRAVSGGYPADQKDALTRFARADFGGAEALVARHVSQNATLFTSVSRGRGSSSPSTSGSDVVERGATVSFGQNFADAIKAHRKANPKMSYEDAAAEVATARPELAASYLSYGRQ